MKWALVIENLIQWSLNYPNSLGPGCVKSSDNQNPFIYIEPCSITLIERTPYTKYSNKAVSATVRITESLNN